MAKPPVPRPKPKAADAASEGELPARPGSGGKPPAGDEAHASDEPAGRPGLGDGQGGLDEGEEVSSSRALPGDGLDFEPGHVIDGKYALESRLAQGGMGAVWVARHLKLNEPVAIKFMRADLAASKESLMRFEREATAVAQLQRKTMHVVHVHDYGLDQGAPYIVMELLEGETLHARLKRFRRLALSETAVVVEQLCSALRPAHEAGIVHRDIKPSNIFINVKGEQEVLKLIDFGLAKGETLEVDGESTKSGGVLGSPHYMSPEQATGDAPVDARADLWAVAVVAYRAVTGKLPFPGTKLGDILVRVARDPAPAPSAVLPGIAGPELDAFFDRALAKRPDERYQTAAELYQAFATSVGLVPTMTGGFRSMTPSMASIAVPDAPISVPIAPAPLVPGDALTAVTEAMDTTPYEPGSSDGSYGGSLGGTSLPKIPSQRRALAIAAAGGGLLLLLTLVAMLSGDELEEPAASVQSTIAQASVGAQMIAAESLAKSGEAQPSAEDDEDGGGEEATPPASATAEPKPPPSAEPKAAGPLPTAPKRSPKPPPRGKATDCPPGGFHPQWGYPCPAR